MTSGTTAEPKYIPVTPAVLAETRRGWNVWGLAALSDHPDCLLRKIVQVTSPMNDHLSPGGTPCGAITGLLAATQKRLVRRYYIVPPIVSTIADAAARYYSIMRFAVPHDVSWLVTASPATLLLLARTADQHRESLFRDIYDGTLADEWPIDPSIRAALAPRLHASPESAGRLERLAVRHGGLYPRHYWRLGFIAHWTGGTMGLYRRQFPAWFGDVPSRDIGLIASEGRMSIPLHDNTSAGVLSVNSHFYEFIHESQYGSQRPDVLRSHELTPGESYFLLLTNAGGLFRYDIGDRVRVTGYMGEAPLIEFLSRDAHSSSLAGEKLTEDQVVLAMRRCTEGDRDRSADAVCSPELTTAPAASSIGTVQFVLAPQWADPPYYRLYVDAESWDRDLQSGLNRPHLSPDLFARLFDDGLCAINIEYASKRHTQRLGPVDVALLPAGFLEQRDRRLQRERARTSEQFKHCYLLATPDADGELAAARLAAS